MNNVFDSTNVDLYHLLGLDPAENNQSIIKKNFSNLIKVFHSDRGGDSRFHQQIQEAYKILSNTSRKFIYDNFGLIGVYAINEDDEILKIYQDIVSSPFSTQEDINAIKNYAKKKILKKLNEKYNKSQDSDFSSADITANYSTPALDYYYLSQFEENKNLHLEKHLNFNKISLDNNFAFYTSEDNNKEVSFDICYNIDTKNYNCEHEYGIELYNRCFLPGNITIFDQSFIDNKFKFTKVVSNDQQDIILKNGITLNNFLRFQSLSITLSPTYSVEHKKLVGLELATNFSPASKYFVSTKCDIINKSLDLTVNNKQSSNKLITMLNLAPNRFAIGAFYFQNISSKYSRSNSIFLRNNGLYLSNESIVHWRHISFKFSSNSQFTINKNNFKFNTSLNIGIQVSSFKIQFPIVIATESNIFTHSLILLSSVLGNLFFKLRKGFYSNSLAKHYAILNKINNKKLNEFIENHLKNYEKKVELEKLETDSMIIEFAFFGEYSKIFEIYKNLKIFGNFKNFDPLIFDVKIPLTLHMVNSKLNIPQNILEIDGVYVPDYRNKDNLALTIMYRFNYNNYTTLIRNNKEVIILPFGSEIYE